MCALRVLLVGIVLLDILMVVFVVKRVGGVLGFSWVIGCAILWFGRWFGLFWFCGLVVFCWVSPLVCDFMLVYVMVGGCCGFGVLGCGLCLGS